MAIQNVCAFECRKIGAIKLQPLIERPALIARRSFIGGSDNGLDGILVEGPRTKLANFQRQTVLAREKVKHNYPPFPASAGLPELALILGTKLSR
jgi:hypothetical protein